MLRKYALPKQMFPKVYLSGHLRAQSGSALPTSNDANSPQPRLRSVTSL